jgi:nitroreductase
MEGVERDPFGIVKQLLAELNASKASTGQAAAEQLQSGVRTRTLSFDSVERRRSVPQFDGRRAPDFSSISDAVGDALAADRGIWRNAPAALGAAVLLSSEDRPSRRLFVWDQSRLDDRGVIDARSEFDWFLQSEMHSAPATIAFYGDLRRTVAASGVHGYRELYSRTGAAAYVAWLALVAKGLSARPVGAFYSATLRRHLGRDDVSARPMLALACGYAPVIESRAVEGD